MILKTPLGVPFVICVLCVFGLMFPVLVSAAEKNGQKNDQAQEYIQVRKIALKDARVQEAYQRADQRLDDRILEIDPSLKSYMDKRNGRQPAATEPVKARAATPAKHPAPAKTGAAGSEVYIVAKGDTLSSIAAQYNVSVASLKSANNITDERKLGVGQKLVIPSSKPIKTTTKAKSGINKPEAPAKKDESWWDKMKSDL